MDAETREALEESIEHWKRMREDPKGSDFPGVNQCSLCGVYYYPNCKGCPVFAKSKRADCAGTPYRRAHNAFRDYQGYPSKGALAAWHEAADAEIAFLEGLREE
jgi:hypothetical protein